MLKCRIGNGEMELEANGNVVDLTTDVAMVIKIIQNKLSDEKAKNFFIEKLTEFLNEKMYEMDAEDVAKLCEKEKEEVKKRTEELDDLLKELMDLIKKR